MYRRSALLSQFSSQSQTSNLSATTPTITNPRPISFNQFTTTNMAPQDVNLAVIKQTFSAYANYLEANMETFHRVLSSYQSYMTTADEIERSAACLRSVEAVEKYLTDRTGRVAVFFPLNLPVYSLVLFAIIPSVFSSEVVVRPPQKMNEVFAELAPLLNFQFFFPNIKVSYADRADFVSTFVADADVIIFTGKEKNARDVLAKTKKDSLFLFNGWGCNPLVISNDADIDLAARKAVEVKTFNSGQDCAGPDNILVHKTVATDFVRRLKDRLHDVKVGDYSDPTVVVGKIAEPTAMVKLGSLLQKHSDSIVYGGTIDFAKSIVYPTVIHTPLSEKTNYEEFFSPIF